MRIKEIFLLAVAVICSVSSVSLSSDANNPGLQDISGLERRVEEIRSRDSISQRQDVGEIFKLADIYASQGNTEKARELYEAGLSVDSFQLDYQLKLANLLKESGDTKQAKEKYKTIYKYSEDEEVINSAKEQLLSLRVKCPSPKQKNRKFSIIVVPFGHINGVLIDEIFSELNKITKIKYKLYEEELNVGGIDRTMAEQYLSKTCANIKRENPGVNIPADSDPKAQMEFIIGILQAEGVSEDKIEDFRERMLINFQVGQRNADRLISELKSQFGSNEDERVVGYLGITEADIYSDDNNYVFGWAQPGFGVMSYSRFKASFFNERDYRPRLVERAVKQGISSTFFILGIPRCTNAMCARAYPHSLAEQDLKEGTLCSWCKEQLSIKLKELQKRRLHKTPFLFN